MFQGFSPETIDFLWGIRLNNNREWFEANKKNYVKYLYEPMKELGKELKTRFNARGGGKPGYFQGTLTATPEELEAFFPVS